MKALVLGGAGFIGYNLTLALLERGHRVTVCDSYDETLYSSSRRRARISSINHTHFDFIESDAREIISPEFLQEVDVVYNLAAVPGLVPSWSKFDSYLNSNVSLVGKLLQALRYLPHVLLVHASTSSVYGAYANKGTDLKPNSPYGVSKLAAEQLIGCYQEEFAIRSVILRYFSVYGPDPRPDQFFSILMEKIQKGEPVTIYGDGTNSRSHAYIDDVVRATISAAEIGPDGEIIDVSGSDTSSTLRGVELVSEAMGIEPKISFAAKRPGDQIQTLGDLQKAKALLDWTPEISIEEGVQRMVSHRQFLLG